MSDLKLTQFIALAAVAILVAGCGGGSNDAPKSDVVIAPTAPPAEDEAAEEEPAEDSTSPAETETAQAETPAAEPAGDQVAAAETSTADAPQAETAKPEMKEEAAGESTEVAAAKPAAEEKPAEEAPADDASKGTTFKGRVVVKGDLPTITPIKPSGTDAYCIDLGEIPNDEVIIGEDNGLANVFVWVTKVPSGVDVPDPPSEPAVLDQQGCRFIPPALAVRVGQDMLVKNDDATLHNTRMTGFANNFNMTVTPNNREGEKVDLKRPEKIIVQVKCDIHAWMSGRLLVTDNPWHAITDKDGNFEINNLPADVELDFRLQHGKAGYVEKSLPLTLKDGEVREQTFEVDGSDLSD